MKWSRQGNTLRAARMYKRKKEDASKKTGAAKNFARAFHEWVIDSKDIKDVPGNIISGLTVSAVALPLNIALAVAAGLPPTAGIISGALGGFVAGFFGGSRWQVSGPAAALNIMVLAIYQQFGVAGVGLAAMMTGLVSLLLSFFGLGQIISKIPEAVISGFTTGVGLKLLDQQIPNLFGIHVSLSEMLINMANPVWLKDVSWLETLSGLGVIFFVMAFKSMPKIPGALLGLTTVTFISTYLNWDITRVGSFTAELPRLSFPFISGSDVLPFALLVVPLSLLAAVESLLSARVADKLAGAKKGFNSTMELFGQGLGNIVSGLFAGMPITGVVVRTSVNVTSGAKNRLSTLVHAGVLLIAMLYFSQAIALIPIAALAGLLSLIGFRLLEFSHFLHLAKSNRIETFAFLIAAMGTVNDKLFLGLVSAVIVAVISIQVKKKAERQLNLILANKNKNLRAKLEPHRQHHANWRVAFSTIDYKSQWLNHVEKKPQVHAQAYVHPKATLIGHIVVERHAHIAAETSVRADEGTPFFVGEKTNLQDGVVLHALKDKYVEVGDQKWAIYISHDVSVAHQALVHGPCFIGANSFVGFKSIVHDAVIGEGCFIGHNALVVGVQVPPNRYVPHGSVIDTQQKAQALPDASESHKHFNEEVLEVNHGLSQAYNYSDSQNTLAEKGNSLWNSHKSKPSSPPYSPSRYL